MMLLIINEVSLIIIRVDKKKPTYLLTYLNLPVADLCHRYIKSSHLIVLVIDRLSAVHFNGSNTRVGNVVALLTHKPDQNLVGDGCKNISKDGSLAPSL